MKRFLAIILALLTAAAALASCGGERTSDATKDEPTTAASEPATVQPTEAGDIISAYGTVHTLYYKDSLRSGAVTATFLNSASGETTDVAMQRIGEDADGATFSCEGDCSRYNMVFFTYGEDHTNAVSFNPCTSGWYKTEDDLLPYAEGGEIDYVAPYDYVQLSGYGYNKNIYIWKPDDYDAESDEKYAAVYMLDGQGMAYFGWDYQPLKGCPVVTTQIEAMTAAAGMKAIVVCIESDVARGNELIPKFATPELEEQFGPQEYDCMDGLQFADFVAHTVVPYVQEHYNVYPDALHTGVSGGSFGGLEAFYMTVEYPEVFGAVGALSPSVYVFTDAQWEAYFSEKDYGDSAPFLYLYTGGVNDTDRDGEVTSLVALLKRLGYPQEKIAFHYFDEGTHSSLIWRAVFSEFLTGMFFRQVKPLQ